jgi:hypothetical protein
LYKVFQNLVKQVIQFRRRLEWCEPLHICEIFSRLAANWEPVPESICQKGKDSTYPSNAMT